MILNSLLIVTTNGFKTGLAVMPGVARGKKIRIVLTYITLRIPMGFLKKIHSNWSSVCVAKAYTNVYWH